MTISVKLHVQSQKKKKIPFSQNKHYICSTIGEQDYRLWELEGILEFILQMKKLRSGEGCSRPGAKMKGQDGEPPGLLPHFRKAVSQGYLRQPLSGIGPPAN